MEAIDYMLKAITFDRLMKVVNKFFERIRIDGGTQR
jgi:hypothetical protein